MRIRLQKYSFRFAEQVLNSKLFLKQEIEETLMNPSINLSELTRPRFNQILKELFTKKGWASQPQVFNDDDELGAKMDFLKERIGIEVAFGHASFIGIDLLKFQVSSYSSLDKIDVGIYIVTTREFQKFQKSNYSNNWEGSLTFEKVIRYLPQFKSAIQIPIYVIGIDI